MRILSLSKDGEAKIKIHSLDDLWHLSQVITPGTEVFGVTLRSYRPEGSKKEEKKKVRIWIRVEKVEFDENTQRLRLLGKIIEGRPEKFVSKGAYHSLEIKPGDEVRIRKEWKKQEIERLKKAEEQAKRIRLAIAYVDYSEATLAVLRQFKLDFEEMSKVISKRGDWESQVFEFFHELAERLSKVECDKILVVGQMGAEKFFVFLKEKFPELFNKVKFLRVSSYGRRAIKEALKRGELLEAIKEQRIAREVELVERLMKELAKNGLCTYGLESVKKACEFGAVDVLLVTDTFFFKNREEFERIARECERTGGKVEVISSKHEHGQILKNLGGIAALLRFKAVL